MIKLKHLITESWKNYIVSNNPETLLYDFYILSYLTTLPLSPEQKGFAGSMIGRDPVAIKQDIDEAENKLLPFLQKQLSDALFIAICAEIRHILDNDQDWENYKGNKLLTHYLRNYKLFGSNLPKSVQPRSDRPPMRTQQEAYKNSYKAAVKAIKDTGSTREQFARLCADLFNNGSWNSSYGGPKWAQIAEAWILLNKTPQTKQQLQVAIDHAYDLQHNTGSVLNKVSTYYIGGDILWLKKALDYKANLKSVYNLLSKASSDMRKLALESFKAANVKRDQLEKTTPPTVNKPQVVSTQDSSESSVEDSKINVDDDVLIKYNGVPFYHGKVMLITDYNINIKVTKKLDPDKGAHNVGNIIAINKYKSSFNLTKLDDTQKPSEKRIDEPKENLSVGDEVEVYVGYGEQPLYLGRMAAITRDGNKMTITVTKVYKKDAGYGVGEDLKIGYGSYKTAYSVKKVNNKSDNKVDSVDEKYVGKYIRYVSPQDDFIGHIESIDQQDKHFVVRIVKNNKQNLIFGYAVVGDRLHLQDVSRMTIVDKTETGSTDNKDDKKIGNLKEIDEAVKLNNYFKQKFVSKISDNFGKFSYVGLDLVEYSSTILTKIIIDIIGSKIPTMDKLAPILSESDVKYYTFMNFKKMKLANLATTTYSKEKIRQIINNNEEYYNNTDTLNSIIVKVVDDFNTDYGDDFAKLFRTIGVTFSKIDINDIKKEFSY